STSTPPFPPASHHFLPALASPATPGATGATAGRGVTISSLSRLLLFSSGLGTAAFRITRRRRRRRHTAGPPATTTPDELPTCESNTPNSRADVDPAAGIETTVTPPRHQQCLQP
ncbi:hypothetical protein V8G54_035608, partial [Vigna mungo]